MYRFLLTTLLLCWLVASSAKGIMWCYDMEGTAYDKLTKSPIRNELLIIDQDTVMTDSLGRFSAHVCGVTCDRGSFWAVRRCNSKAHDRIPVGRLASLERVLVRSRWKKFGVQPIITGKARSERETYKKDLFLE